VRVRCTNRFLFTWHQFGLKADTDDFLLVGMEVARTPGA